MATKIEGSGWGENKVLPIKIIHDDCGGIVSLEDDSGCGTSWTGCWGGVKVKCDKCEYEEYIHEN